MNSEAALYTAGQRRFATAYGLCVHALFAVAILLMAASIYTGLAIGRGPFHGAAGIAMNLLLLAQFPIAHSFLLSDRGKRWLARGVPMNLGRPLATTTFAGIASAQLALCFLAWSPSGVVLWTPPVSVRVLLSVLFALSWLVLVRAMKEAGTGLQTGSLGWRSVAGNVRPAFPPLATRGLHKVIRQPIYASFALILWTSPAFTADRLVLATVWTLYCVFGSRIKEKRLSRIHGATFAEYRKRVPFWIPSRRKPSVVTASAPVRAPDADVIVIGGGPVGLLLASLLEKKNHTVLLFESNPNRPRRSMAIGITPPSLEVLSELGLDVCFIDKGLRIQDAFVHEQGREVGRLDLRDSRDAIPFILSLPQTETVDLLRSHLETRPTVRLMSGWRVTGIQQDSEGVTVSALRADDSATESFRARLAAGCDGSRSEVCSWLGIRKTVHTYAPSFTMADFTDRSGLGAQAHLFFGPERPVESFPLPEGRRRWIVRSGRRGQQDLHEPVEEGVSRLTGFRLQAEDRIDCSQFQPLWKLARRFHRGRVALCGDAAHVMSPIGGQGMNTGLGDAAFLARAFTAILEGRGSVDRWLNQYHRLRRLAFRRAARRAALGMTLGTAHGGIASHLRGRLLQYVLQSPPTRRWVLRWLTMRSLPALEQQIRSAARGLGEEVTA